VIVWICSPVIALHKDVHSTRGGTTHLARAKIFSAQAVSLAPVVSTNIGTTHNVVAWITPTNPASLAPVVSTNVGPPRSVIAWITPTNPASLASADSVKGGIPPNASALTTVDPDHAHPEIAEFLAIGTLTVVRASLASER
jgi:hypothetical protein